MRDGITVCVKLEHDLFCRKLEISGLLDRSVHMQIFLSPFIIIKIIVPFRP